ncbi:hypothetical protein TNCV_206401 [Trichonephila clavipes]|nr:hypothetical protein TNCV_206401 [Trichonephila clavipes]
MEGNSHGLVVDECDPGLKHNSGYDTQFVIEWILFESQIKHGSGKEVGLSPEMDSHLERKAARPFYFRLGL